MKKLIIIFITIIFFTANAAAQLNNNMIYINGGMFIMGSPVNEEGRASNEIQRNITVGSFYISRFPITQKEFQEIMGHNPSSFKGDNLPVENITWWDALEYCNRRSQRERLTPVYTIDKSQGTAAWNRSASGYRLPTEAEWEYACRAGTTTPYNTGIKITSDQANFNGVWQEELLNEFGVITRINRGEYRKKTTQVGTFAPNARGLYDMHGNVWEWCWDLFGPYASGTHTNPTGMISGYSRVMRGGSWSNSATNIRSAYRVDYDPGSKGNDIGFRVVRQ
jgi:formylglycine-generating enzyme required for sulfatase activity